MEPLSRDRDAFFADAKAFLSRARTPGGPSVMEHVGELLLHLAEERPQVRGWLICCLSRCFLVFVVVV
jgi:hypothetical protein